MKEQIFTALFHKIATSTTQAVTSPACLAPSLFAITIASQNEQLKSTAITIEALIARSSKYGSRSEVTDWRYSRISEPDRRSPFTKGECACSRFPSLLQVFVSHPRRGR